MRATKPNFALPTLYPQHRLLILFNSSRIAVPENEKMKTIKLIYVSILTLNYQRPVSYACDTIPYIMTSHWKLVATDFKVLRNLIDTICVVKHNFMSKSLMSPGPLPWNSAILATHLSTKIDFIRLSFGYVIAKCFLCGMCFTHQCLKFKSESTKPLLKSD